MAGKECYVSIMGERRGFADPYFDFIELVLHRSIQSRRRALIEKGFAAAPGRR